MTAGRTFARLRRPQRPTTFDARRPERADPMLEDVFGIQTDDAGESGVHLLHWPPELGQGCVFERGIVLHTVVLDGTQTRFVGRTNLLVFRFIEHRDFSITPPAVLSLHGRKKSCLTDRA